MSEDARILVEDDKLSEFALFIAQESFKVKAETYHIKTLNNDVSYLNSAQWFT